MIMSMKWQEFWELIAKFNFNLNTKKTPAVSINAMDTVGVFDSKTS